MNTHVDIREVSLRDGLARTVEFFRARAAG